MAPLGIDRVGNTILNRVFAHDQELHRCIGVVDERVSDAGTRRKSDCIALLELGEVTIDPETRPAFHHEDELLVSTVGVGHHGVDEA